MEQDIAHKRVYWACRRGMLELDLMLIPFFEEKYTSLSQEDKELFVKLLEFPDPELHTWLSNKSCPHDPNLAKLVRSIRTFIQTKTRT